MREIRLEEYSKNKLKNKLTLLKVKEEFNDQKKKGSKSRDLEKQIFLYKMALRSKQNKFEKVNDREYNLI